MPDKRRIFLYIAILIPIVMILVTAFEVYFYQVSITPKYKFLYLLSKSDNGADCWLQIKNDFYPSHDQTTIKSNPNACQSSQLYVFDFSNNTSTAISLADAKKLSVSPTYKSMSPDGFDVSYYCSSEFIGWPLLSTNNIDVCIKKNNYFKRLHLRHYNADMNEYYYFYFISWILTNTANTPSQ